MSFSLDAQLITTTLHTDLIRLVQCDDAALVEQCAQQAQALTRARFGNVRFAYIPLYLSNVCVNECAYCGFNVHNKVKRVTLTVDEIRTELTAIYAKGFRSILLVSGESAMQNAAYFVDAVSIARDVGFHAIAVEIGMVDHTVAAQLVHAGADAFVLYQETFHRETYTALHGKGPKANYDARLRAVEIALEAGFRRVGVGFLGGLYDPLFEISALYLYVSWLRKKWWDRECSISIPRITDAHNVQSEQYRLDDALFVRMLIALRIAFPDVPLLLSTRESAQFRDGMLGICVTHLSISSRTFPGGYASSAADELAQFTTHDNRSLEDITHALRQKGLDVCFKDWENKLS